MKKSLNLLLLFSLLFFPFLSLPVKAQTGGGTFIHYVKLGHWQGSTFVEDETLPASNGAGKVEVWTQPTSAYDNGKKVATGDVGSPISLSPGKYRLSSKVSLPSGYDSGSFKEANCPDFEIQAGQTVVCTFQAYKKSDPRNYEGLIPSSEKPSGAPPMVEVDSSLGSYQFVKNVVDISDKGDHSSINYTGFLSLYGKKLLVIQDKRFKITNARYQGDGEWSFFVSFYDISNPFSPALLKENELGKDNKYLAIFSGITNLSSFITIDNLPFIYWVGYRPGESRRSVYFFKVNSDWSIGNIEEFAVQAGDSNKTGYWLMTFFSGLDGKVYGLALTPDEEKQYYPGCAPIAVLRFDANNPKPSKIAEIDQMPHLNNKCGSEVAYNEWKSFRWSASQSVRIGNKLYLVVPTDDVVARLHVVERAWVSVFDFSNPTSPQFLGMDMLSGLNNQTHFPDASEAEKIKIYADAGIIEVDKATGYVYDIFPHMYDFQNAEFLLSGGGVRAADIFFKKIKGPWRYRNGVIIRKVNQQGEFDYLSRFTLCETEGGRTAGANSGSYHRITCGDSREFYGQKTFDKAFYGLGSYITLLPFSGSHAFNGVLLLKDLTKSHSSTYGIGFTTPVVASVMVGNNLKVIPDTSNEFMKFKDSLKKTVTAAGDQSYGLNTLDAHLQQVDNKTFAIFQIHPASIDVVKLTLTQPRPLPSDFSPQSTTTILTTASATPSMGALSPIQGTLYSIRSILNNLRRILNR
ncbi:MAG: hypothetical protein KatS3mg098_079 [Candidatus Parcubacteria bacterium]|nr:MAG: hypothetical protein KatS3mg098_079 [Candidatus Parcubacteria bacterium]